MSNIDKKDKHCQNGCSNNLVAAIDQGTSSSRFLVFSVESSELVTYHQVEIKKIYPNEGWVEQDPWEIYHSVIKCIDVVAKKLPDLGFKISDIQCVGVTNQRESTILWDSNTGKPLYNSIVWLDNRTNDLVENIVDKIPGRDLNCFKTKTGLPISTYFSALKIKWLIDNVSEVKHSLNNGTLMFGTVDSWLLWNLIGKHLTDVTNASRTLLMDLETLQWDKTLCDFFKIPMSILPKIQSSSSFFGEINHGSLKSIPITGVIGDQNAALVGQKCLDIGQIKVTYGTGAFLMQNIGPGPLNGAYKSVPKKTRNNLLTTVGYKLGDEMACYALEGSIAIAGAAITWLRDNLEIIENYGEVEDLGRLDSSSGGMYFVPAFQGLYAPYWDAYATGLIIGISQFSRKCHLIRATLEGVAFQTNDILSLMANGLQYGIRVDGGMSSNDLLCQLLANISGNVILRANMTESTAFGAAAIASYHFGLWYRFLKPNNKKNNINNLKNNHQTINNHLNGNLRNIDNQIINETIIIKTQKNSSIFSQFISPIFSFITGIIKTNNVEVFEKSTDLPVGFLSDDIKNQYELFKPELNENVRLDLVKNWRSAVQRCRKWIQIEQNKQKQVEYLRWSMLPLAFYILTSVGLCIISK